MMPAPEGPAVVPWEPPYDPARDWAGHFHRWPLASPRCGAGGDGTKHTRSSAPVQGKTPRPVARGFPPDYLLLRLAPAPPARL